MGRGLPIPAYDVVERSGPDHAPLFRIAARVEGIEPGIGEGSSKRLAEQEAARAILQREGIVESRHRNQRAPSPVDSSASRARFSCLRDGRNAPGSGERIEDRNGGRRPA